LKKNGELIRRPSPRDMNLYNIIAEKAAASAIGTEIRKIKSIVSVEPSPPGRLLKVPPKTAMEMNPTQKMKGIDMERAFRERKKIVDSESHIKEVIKTT